MAGRNGQVMIGTYVPLALAEKFKAWARSTQGGASAELRGLITNAMEGRQPPPPSGGAAGHLVMVRLKETERLALVQAARAHSTTPANWLRSLAIAHLGRRPQWNTAEVEALRELFIEVRRIGNNVDQIARVINTASHTGEYPARQGEEAREAAELLRVEMRRIVAVMTGNFDYWGLPDADRSTSASGAPSTWPLAGLRDAVEPGRRAG